MSPATRFTVISCLVVSLITPSETSSWFDPFIEWARSSPNMTCVNNRTGTRSLATEGLISFNFYEASRTVRTYQVPKCIFMSSVSKTIMQGVDLFESLESYRRRYYSYIIVPVHASFQIFIHDLRTDLSSPTEELTSPVDKTLPNVTIWHTPSGYVIRLLDVVTPRFEECTLFPNHTVIFDMTVPCSQEVYLRQTGKHQFAIVLTFTPSFFVLNIQTAQHQHVTENDEDVILIFGDVRSIDVKAPYSKPVLTLRQSYRDDLLIVAKTSIVNATYPFIKTQDFLKGTLSGNYLDFNHVYTEFNRLVIHNLVEGLCDAPPDDRTVSMVFSYAVLARTLYHTSNVTARLEDVALRYVRLTLARTFLQQCFDVGPRYMRFPTIDGALSVLLKLIRNSRDVDGGLKLSLTFALIFGNNTDMTKERDLENALYEMKSIHRAGLVSPLSPRQRSLLYMMAYVTHHTTAFPDIRREMLAMQTSLCSPQELYNWAPHVSSAGLTMQEMFTPCSGSGRRDYSEARIAEIVQLNPLTTKTPADLYRILAHFDRSNLTNFPALSCISHLSGYVAVTLRDVTYVVSSNVMLKGTSYPVTNLAVDKTMIVTVSPAQHPCEKTEVAHATRSIPIVKNITIGNDCEYCKSAIMEYDEVNGLSNIVYLADTADLVLVTNLDNRILASSPRTRYIMMTANGTLMEITSVIIDIRQTSIFMIMLYCSLGVLLLYGLYRLLHMI
ncbi:GP75 [Caviid betaherpesvirus 2]|uniref:Envelope glycoprotein H n=1 Tax=Guinea pig cytomegalovirus (strain 22122) TaxID=103920 RepID=GH_GPCMV|nr:GP75 [Caviid betaherpesvirus 2]P87730.2 RecName: Full=Envelope glycoprotein H; Short=gH; Flags: Precursor [Guinea pig cytomegalovirus (strain 22122 / ATCC VR682) (GPCMV)]AGE11545.1 GP75 [Caviid betaherpesvirus 2]AIL83933.1 GP75 [BAC cloning vector GPN13BACdenovo_preserved(MM)]BAJ78533.1 GP75 [Caviid betaherpesvirus 2]